MPVSELIKFCLLGKQNFMHNLDQNCSENSAVLADFELISNHENEKQRTSMKKNWPNQNNQMLAFTSRL